MRTTLAFDVYGTLIDTDGVVEALQKIIGDKAGGFSRTWRDKQLEYSFRRGLMQNYENFAVCTSQALDYTCLIYNVPLTDSEKEELLGIYRILPAFSDVKAGLNLLQTAGFRLYAFSNGKTDAFEILLDNADIRDLFQGVVSVDDIKTFKPSPATYCHFLRQAKATGDRAWMISSNPFDVIGAMSAGMKAAWVQRSPGAVFDPWGIEPTITINNLLELNDGIHQHSLC
ncbi:haloacid dehalogenase type II [Desulforhopalus sp. IMCC35007]|uniref:haloacid dehalogenase type II n=1 Tax=Desulforhopalus sp. IMCC35007 TaxID=2569543 RepID=UPI0010AED685|nr:haloacid dehalogenase type II [Desulforhopalus sp. IMCC35007]TKB09659.1 haloacid dehalogenase type II [Desulforhopalus sp. IMCC35007]